MGSRSAWTPRVLPHGVDTCRPQLNDEAAVAAGVCCCHLYFFLFAVTQVSEILGWHHVRAQEGWAERARPLRQDYRPHHETVVWPKSGFLRPGERITFINIGVCKVRGVCRVSSAGTGGLNFESLLSAKFDLLCEMGCLPVY
jgi:hypothetical protein